MTHENKETPPSETTPVDFTDKGEKKDFLELSNFKNIISAVRQFDKIRDLEPHITNQLTTLINNSGLSDYVVLFLYDPFGSIEDSTVDRLYSAIPKKREQNILLILNSPGGQIEPAYLISKCSKEYSNKFVVAIPRKAKSAATLLALGANEIHMGTMSELGPIDPQIGGLPALGLSDAIAHLAKLCSQYPDSSEMFSKYLSQQLQLRTLGYFERVSQSAVQYAQRLLQDKSLPKSENATSVASKLVYSYKDHNFVIDKDEAYQIFGDYIKTNTKEYELSNRVHNFLEIVNICTSILKNHYVSVIGDITDISFTEKEEK